ncbi:MAG TPA: cation:proton antiporter [Kiritimatiellia bacterium]|nr:cation:proton antiporter [Kiritimatiellia bacterium]
MNPILIVGLVIITGFLFGELAQLVKLPKVTGYILAGICINPRLLPLIPQDFTTHTDLITNVALSFITFSVGGTLLAGRLKKLGKTILWITVFEAEFALLAVVLGFLALAPFVGHGSTAAWAGKILPLGILLGCLASPTDPSATLAVSHEYHAKGDVSSTIMGVAAFDDVFGIINYSLAVAAARILLAHTGFAPGGAVVAPAVSIVGGVLTGAAFGWLFNQLARFMKRDTEGAFIVLVFALLSLCFGLATVLKVDELLATMTMGVIVVNFNPNQEIIFRMLERYTEELIFVLFFTLSGMQLNFATLRSSLLFVALFVVFRAIGKGAGATFGAFVSHASPNVKKYTALGLLPQGGIVIGLALMIKANPAFASISDSVVGIVIGATVIHEIIGPIAAEIALKKAGEIA